MENDTLNFVIGLGVILILLSISLYIKNPNLKWVSIVCFVSGLFCIGIAVWISNVNHEKDNEIQESDWDLPIIQYSPLKTRMSGSVHKKSKNHKNTIRFKRSGTDEGQTNEGQTNKGKTKNKNESKHVEDSKIMKMKEDLKVLEDVRKMRRDKESKPKIVDTSTKSDQNDEDDEVTILESEKVQVKDEEPSVKMNSNKEVIGNTFDFCKWKPGEPIPKDDSWEVANNWLNSDIYGEEPSWYVLNNAWIKPNQEYKLEFVVPETDHVFGLQRHVFNQVFTGRSNRVDRLIAKLLSKDSESDDQDGTKLPSALYGIGLGYRDESACSLSFLESSMTNKHVIQIGGAEVGFEFADAVGASDNLEDVLEVECDQRMNTKIMGNVKEDPLPNMLLYYDVDDEDGIHQELRLHYHPVSNIEDELRVVSRMKDKKVKRDDEDVILNNLMAGRNILEEFKDEDDIDVDSMDESQSDGSSKFDKIANSSRPFLPYLSDETLGAYSAVRWRPVYNQDSLVLPVGMPLHEKRVKDEVWTGKERYSSESSDHITDFEEGSLLPFDLNGRSLYVWMKSDGSPIVGEITAIMVIDGPTSAKDSMNIRKWKHMLTEMNEDVDDGADYVLRPVYMRLYSSEREEDMKMSKRCEWANIVAKSM